jgi:thiamine-monophosphate kinase
LSIKKIISDIGETRLIKIIEEIINEITGKTFLRDDSFFFALPSKDNGEKIAVFNSDMFVSSTDAPTQMSYYEIGKKVVLMNVSDVIVKGAKPKGIIISLGIPKNMKLEDFKNLIRGIVDRCKKLDLDYIGGDINETKEVIVSPTVFGFQKASKIIHRKEVQTGNLLVANGKFGLTGVGFDILLKKKGDLNKFQSYQRSIASVLEPSDIGREALALAENDLATASIDSSDGLGRSLRELMLSNPHVGFEVEFNDELIDEEALNYSNEYGISLENLVFNAGEEFIHLFTMSQENYYLALEKFKDQGTQLFKIGKAISEEKVYFIKDGKKNELEVSRGFEHFKKKKSQ